MSKQAELVYTEAAETAEVYDGSEFLCDLCDLSVEKAWPDSA